MRPPCIERVYALGPEGTFSEKAAHHVRGHISPSANVILTRTIPEAVSKAAGDPQSVAVVPIENSASGMVVATQDRIAAEPVVIEWRVDVRVRYKVLAGCPLDEVAKIYVHPVAHAQCENYLANTLPGAEVMFTRSNADSGRRVLADVSGRAAGVIPVDYGLTADQASWVRATDIQDDHDNCTRFVVVRSKDSAGPRDFTRAATSLLIHPESNRPGVLAEILGLFAMHEINLARVESRPARKQPWTYVFFVDLDNTENSPHAVAAVSRRGHRVTVLGTYNQLDDVGARRGQTPTD